MSIDDNGETNNKNFNFDENFTSENAVLSTFKKIDIDSEEEEINLNNGK